LGTAPRGRNYTVLLGAEKIGHDLFENTGISFPRGLADSGPGKVSHPSLVAASAASPFASASFSLARSSTS